MSDEVPKWLQRGYGHDRDGLYELTEDADSTACVTVPGVESNVRRTLAEWSEWRAEMAKLLGLVEPGVTVKIEDVPTTMTFGPNGVVWSRADGGKAIAAELRRLHASLDAVLTEACEHPQWEASAGLTYAMDELRKRADELDPGEGG